MRGEKKEADVEKAFRKFDLEWGRGVGRELVAGTWEERGLHGAGRHLHPDGNDPRLAGQEEQVDEVAGGWRAGEDGVLL